MPKGKPKFSKRLDFYTTTEARAQLEALSFLLGMKGEKSKICRKILDLGLKTFIDGLEPKKKAEYEFILNRVKLAEEQEHAR